MITINSSQIDSDKSRFKEILVLEMKGKAQKLSSASKRV